jgi:hypothetical protein
MKIIELIITDEDKYGVNAISLVESPAIEEDFIHFSKQEVKFKTIDEDKRIVMGAILTPDKPIYRKNDMEEWYVIISKDTIRKVAYAYLKKGRQSEATLEHEEKINGVHLVESWIVDGENDKSKDYGMDLPKGTWMGAMYVENDTIWNDYVKTGKVKGFSIEGNFLNKAEAMAKATIKKDSRYKGGKKVEMESYTDYPEAVRNNAQRGIYLNEKNGNKCATQVGKVRAQQLAKGEPISEETIKRMYSYLSRAEEFYDEGDTSACGTISFLLWGGKAALRWSKSKLNELELSAEVQECIEDQLVKDLEKLLS